MCVCVRTSCTYQLSSTVNGQDVSQKLKRIQSQKEEVRGGNDSDRAAESNFLSTSGQIKRSKDAGVADERGENRTEGGGVGPLLRRVLVHPRACV